MAALPIQLVPFDRESATGYLIRALTANGAQVREVLALQRGSKRRQVNFSDADVFAALTGVERLWFECRVPVPVQRDRWMEIELFGRRWRDDWSVRSHQNQVCSLCLAESGFARMEWDLAAYAACHIHGVILQDQCSHCGRAILSNRPALDVCSCGNYVSLAAEELVKASERVIAWSTWLSRLLTDAPRPIHSVATGLPADIAGLSPDGGYRVIQAFAGGQRAFKGALLNSATPWLSSRAIHDLLQQGLDELFASSHAPRAVRRCAGACADALAEQSLRGISAIDRAVAASLMERLRVRPRWRNIKPTLHRQGELFEVSSES